MQMGSIGYLDILRNAYKVRSEEHDYILSESNKTRFAVRICSRERRMKYSCLALVVGLVSGILPLITIVPKLFYSYFPCTCIFLTACRRDKGRIFG